MRHVSSTRVGLLSLAVVVLGRHQGLESFEKQICESFAMV